MAAERAKRDANRKYVVMAVTDDVAMDPVMLRIDPVTLRLEVDILFT